MRPGSARTHTNTNTNTHVGKAKDWGCNGGTHTRTCTQRFRSREALLQVTVLALSLSHLCLQLRDELVRSSCLCHHGSKSTCEHGNTASEVVRDRPCSRGRAATTLVGYALLRRVRSF